MPVYVEIYQRKNSTTVTHMVAHLLKETTAKHPTGKKGSWLLNSEWDLMPVSGEPLYGMLVI